MKIVSVTGSNFRSYEGINWLLPQSGLHLIDGQNTETGRSNMAGKSTSIDSVFHCLYGYLPKWGSVKGGQADAVIKRGHKKSSVTVTVEHSGKRIQVTRERPLKLRVFVDGVELHGKAADLDKQIPALIGMTAEQFLIAVYVAQNRATSFFNMSDSERTALISTVAGLQAMDAALEKAKAKKSDIQAKIDKQSGSIEVLELQLVEIPERRDDTVAHLEQAKAALATAQAEYDQAAKDALVRKAEITNLFSAKKAGTGLSWDIESSDIARTIHELKNKRQELEAQITAPPTVGAEFSDPIFQLRAAIGRTEEEVRSAALHNAAQDKAQANNDRIQELIARELDLMDEASQGKCSHCKQALPPDQQEQAAALHLKKARDLEARLVVAEEKISTDDTSLASMRAKLEAASQAYAVEKARLEARPNQLRKDIQAIDQQMLSVSNEHKLKEKGFADALRLAQADYDAQIAKEDTKLSVAANRLSNARGTLELNTSALANLTAIANGLMDKLNEANVRMAALRAEMDEALDLIDLFGPKGFRAICFEGLIERISERAGELFALMTDGLYSTRIDQVGETAKGEQKMILRPVITRGGLDVSPDDLSGGAEATVALAYDVAVSEAVGDSSVLFLDEALDGLDPQGKAEALRLLEEVARTRAVILIDHTSEIRSAIDSVLQVEYSGDTSRMASGFEPAIEA
jgi:DNA repair exonuclease SbcCD ATPase subunit